jgi:hypothetical protein
LGTRQTEQNKDGGGENGGGCEGDLKVVVVMVMMSRWVINQYTSSSSALCFFISGRTKGL